MTFHAQDGRAPLVAHVITSLERGGAQAMLTRLVGRLSGFRHDVYSLMDRGAFGDELASLGARVRCLHIDRPTAPASVVRLLAHASADRPAILHGWMYHGACLAWLAGKAAPRAKLVWGVRQTLYDLSKESFSTRQAIRWMARRSVDAGAITYNSDLSAAQHEAIGFRADKRRVIDNGFDLAAIEAAKAERARLRAEWGIGAEDVLIGLVARVHPMKGHSVFIAAAEEVARRYRQARFLVSGAGTIGQDGLGGANPSPLLAERLLRLGERGDALAVSAALDIACSASLRGEGFSNAIGEAMGAGVCCVITDVGDGKRVLGEAGLVCEPGDGAALAAALGQAIDMGLERRAALGALGAQRVRERFSIEAAAAAHEALYRELLDG